MTFALNVAKDFTVSRSRLSPLLSCFLILQKHLLPAHEVHQSERHVHLSAGVVAWRLRAASLRRESSLLHTLNQLPQDSFERYSKAVLSTEERTPPPQSLPRIA